MKTRYILLAVAALLSAVSCNDTWLMYDNSQKPKLYFNESLQTHSESFALLADDTVSVSTTVYVMGNPVDHDRTYALDYFGAESGESISMGSVTYPLVSAVYGEDFTVDDLVIPAGEVSGTLKVILRRTPKMLDSCYVKVGIRLSSNDEFDPCAPDSSSTSAILTPEFIVYVNDGDPACPNWWRTALNKPLGWHYDLGNFYPAKYRKMLEYFHATQETHPAFFEHNAELFGYNLDSPNPKLLTTTQMRMTSFWRQSYAYSSSWAIFVMKPLYDYYRQYYKDHPEDPNWEDMDLAVNINAAVGWASPIDGPYGYFN